MTHLVFCAHARRMIKEAHHINPGRGQCQRVKGRLQLHEVEFVVTWAARNFEGFGPQLTTVMRSKVDGKWVNRSTLLKLIGVPA